MTDVVLFNPPWNPQSSVDGIYYTSPPLDLCLAAAAVEQAGMTVRLFDHNVQSEASFAGFLAAEKPLVIGLNAPSVALPLAYKALLEIHEWNPKVDVVLMGQHVSDDPEIIAEFGVQYGMPGYAETGFAKLCELLVLKKGRLSDIDGLVHSVHCNVSIRHTAKTSPDESLLPAWHLAGVKRYAFLSIAASRGCSFQCLYCGSSGPFCPKSKEYILRSSEAVIAELRHGIMHGMHVYDFIDDVFTHDETFVTDLCAAILKEKLPIRWTCSTRPDLLTPHLTEVMKQAGCVQVCIGVESGSAAVRKQIGRDISDSQIRNAFKACRRLGVKTRASALIGLLGETKETIEDTIAFVRELNPTHALFYPVILLPGSTLFNLAVKEGMVQKDVWARYMRGEASLPVYLPKGMTRADISNYLKEAHRRFYHSLGHFFQQLLA